MSNFLDNLPPDLQREIAMKKRIGTKAYAEILGLSVWAARARWKAGLIPAPTADPGGRKKTIPLGVALEAAGRAA